MRKFRRLGRSWGNRLEGARLGSLGPNRPSNQKMTKVMVMVMMMMVMMVLVMMVLVMIEMVMLMLRYHLTCLRLLVETAALIDRLSPEKAVH